MGFMDKAKKLAEQAQEKLDEKQGQFNAKQSGGAGMSAGTPAVEYDQFGRPVGSQPVESVAPAGPPEALGQEPAPAEDQASDPPAHAAGQAPDVQEPTPVIAPGSVAPPEDLGHPDSLEPKDQATPAEAVAPAEPAPAPEPSAPAAPSGAVPGERSDGDYTPPPVSSGDPLAG